MHGSFGRAWCRQEGGSASQHGQAGRRAGGAPLWTCRLAGLWWQVLCPMLRPLTILLVASPSHLQGGFNRPLDAETTGQKVGIEWLR